MKSFLYIAIAVLVTSLVAFGQTTPPDGFGTTALSADLSPLNLVPPEQDRTESGQAEVEITLVSGAAGGSDSAVVSFEITVENAQAVDATPTRSLAMVRVDRAAPWFLALQLFDADISKRHRLVVAQKADVA